MKLVLYINAQKDATQKLHYLSLARESPLGFDDDNIRMVLTLPSLCFHCQLWTKLKWKILCTHICTSLKTFVHVTSNLALGFEFNQAIVLNSKISSFQIVESKNSVLRVYYWKRYYATQCYATDGRETVIVWEKRWMLPDARLEITGTNVFTEAQICVHKIFHFIFVHNKQ